MNKKQVTMDKIVEMGIKIHEITKEMTRFDNLEEDHRNLKKLLEETIQPKMRFLLLKHNEADQIAKAASQGFVKTPRYMPPDDIQYWPAVRLLVVQAVYSIWDEHERPTEDRREVIPIVQKQVVYLKRLGKWKRSWEVPGRDTIIRRLNESADKRHYEDEPTPCIAVRAGQYMPNPQRFIEPIRSKLSLLSNTWIRRKK